MKNPLQKKWFRRVCQVLLALVSLLVLAYVGMNWWGARMKRDIIARMRAEGRPTSIAELLRPLPRDEDNFAMVPILAEAREEWWSGSRDGKLLQGDHARKRLGELVVQAANLKFANEGKPDLGAWKQNLELSGSDSECLDAYDLKFAGVLSELRAGIARPETVSPMLHQLAASPGKEVLSLNSGFIMSLSNVAASLGFRTELALAANRPEVAHESLIIAMRLGELVGSEGTLISQLLEGKVIRTLQPTLARALRTGGWDKNRIASIRRELAAQRPLDAYRRALDLENVTTFAMFEEVRRNPQAFSTMGFDADWKRWLLTNCAKDLPVGCYQANASVWVDSGLQLRRDLDTGDNLRSWLNACDHGEERGKSSSRWRQWLYPLAAQGLAGAFRNGCWNQTVIQQGILACDLETYRLDHGRYPEHLQDLGSPETLDSLTGEPFLWKITDSGYLLYSVGADGRDDGGKRGKFSIQANVDLVW